MIRLVPKEEVAEENIAKKSKLAEQLKKKAGYIY